MKTETITRAFRNSTSAAARLAAWQDLPLGRRRQSGGGKYSGPEMSAPESPCPLLWVAENSPEVAAIYDGKSLRMRNVCAWYCDEWQDQTIETVAIILTRFPRLIFYGVRNSDEHGTIRVELSDFEPLDFVSSERGADDERSAMAADILRGCDRKTQREAEESREYYRTENLKNQMEENAAELETIAAEMSGLTDKMADLICRRRDLRAENEALASEI